MPAEIRTHWEGVYSTKAEREVSWFQENPAPSIEMIYRAGASRLLRLIDIGGGASRLAETLLDRPFEDITVLDLSSAALESAKARLREAGGRIRWIVADVTKWEPDRTYDVWHDRAAFHFLTDELDRRAYVDRLTRALKPGGHAVIATFALDGPEKCSGLPVMRYEGASLARELGEGFELTETRPHTHVTPWGSEQRFQFSLFRKRAVDLPSP